MWDAEAWRANSLLCCAPVLNVVCVFPLFRCVFNVCSWIFKGFRDQFLTASVSYCQHYCLWHSFISRKTGSRDGCLALLSQRLQLTWPWMCIGVLVCSVWGNVCICVVCVHTDVHMRVVYGVLDVLWMLEIFQWQLILVCFLYRRK